MDLRRLTLALSPFIALPVFAQTPAENIKVNPATGSFLAPASWPNIFGLVNGTNGQAFNLYGYLSGGDTSYLNVQAVGFGTQWDYSLTPLLTGATTSGKLSLFGNGKLTLGLVGGQNWNMSGSAFAPTTDNVYDIGDSTHAVRNISAKGTISGIGSGITGLQDPIVTSSPILDFQPELLNIAEGATVTSISDAYGNTASAANAVGLYGSAVAPTMRNSGINGWPGLYCGTNMAMATPSIFSGTYSAFSWMIVVNPLTCTDTFGTVSFSFGNLYTSNFVGLGTGLNTIGSSGVTSFSYRVGAASKANQFRGSAFRPQVIIGVYDGTNYYLDIDGQCVSALSASGALSISGPMIFGNIYSDANIMTAVYGRMSGWTRALTPTERRTIGRFAYRKYCETGNKRVWGIGTSFAQGLLANSNATQFDLLQPNIPENRVSNACVAAPLGDMANMIAGVAPFPDLLSAMQGGVVIIDDESADLGAGTTASTLYGYVTTLVAQFHAQGDLVLVTTSRPKMTSTTGATQTANEAQRILFNTAVLGNAAGADATFDLTTLVCYNSPTSYTNGTYYIGGAGGGDYTGAHPTTAAYALEIPGKTAAIKSLLRIPNNVTLTVNTTSTITFNSGSYSETIYNTSASTQATATITLPAISTPGQVVRYITNGIITALTISGTVDIGTNPSSAAVASSFAWQSDVSGHWVRLY